MLRIRRPSRKICYAPSLFCKFSFHWRSLLHSYNGMRRGKFIPILLLAANSLCHMSCSSCEPPDSQKQFHWGEGSQLFLLGKICFCGYSQISGCWTQPVISEPPKVKLRWNCDKLLTRELLEFCSSGLTSKDFLKLLSLIVLQCQDDH